MSKPTKTSTVKKISHDDARATLYYLDDIFGRAQMPYFVRGKTLKSVMNGGLLEDPITVGVRGRYLTEFGMGVLKQNLVLKITKKKGKISTITTKHNKVPISIKAYHRNYGMIKNLDEIIYQYDSIPVPNPPEKLIQSDGLLR